VALADLERFGGAVSDKFAARLISGFGKSVSHKIVLSGSLAKLNGIDERAYEVYSRLIERYAVILGLVRPDTPCTDDRAQGIFDGIAAVISSRFKFAEENGGFAGSNPVTAEKNRLVACVLQGFYREYKLVPKDALNARAHIQSALYAANAGDIEPGARAAFAQLVQHARALSRPTYTVYCGKCRELVAALNDLNLRKSASYYFRMIETERDILEPIVKIQLGALTSEAEEQPALCAIRECYQVFTQEADKVLEAFRSALNQDDCPGRPPFESYDSYHADIFAKLAEPDLFPAAALEQIKAELPALHSAYRQSLSAVLLEIIDTKVSKARLDHTLYELRKSVTQSTIMAGEIAEVFRKTHEYAANRKDELDGQPGAEIIAGINETTAIKIMNIQDSKGEFYEEAMRKLVNYMADGRELLSSVFDALRAEVEAALLPVLPSVKPENILQTVEAAFEQAYEQSFTQRVGKTSAVWQSEIHKHILTFKREVLLYEMGTFDEIMNFSVSKLTTEPANTPSQEYAAALHNAHAELLEILGRNGISRIQPQPHDSFDGKEHDVLMAERTEGFAKGEIVKTFSSGYREGDTVLVRASVIAAK